MTAVLHHVFPRFSRGSDDRCPTLPNFTLEFLGVKRGEDQPRNSPDIRAQIGGGSRSAVENWFPRWHGIRNGELAP